MLHRFFDHTIGTIFKAAGVGLILPDRAVLTKAETDAPTVRFTRWRDLFAVMLRPELRFAEAFAHGTIDIKDGRIYDVLIRLAEATYKSPMLIFARIWATLTAPVLAIADGWTPKKSKKNVQAHYDLGNDLYRLFLDPDMQYSCAYFATENDTLEDAQKQKKQHIINKLLLKPDMTCLDIGCGWGGLSLSLAQAGGLVTGLTLAEEQYALAKERLAKEQKTKNTPKNTPQVEFLLKDYRLETRQFDRITSVGMFEHVGPAMFKQYFQQIDQNLKDDGIALVHTIVRTAPPKRVNRFITKYIFPGGYIPSLSQIAKAIEPTNLIITDVECLYIHYAETLKHWRLRFLSNRQKAVALYDEKFARIWEFYLAACEVQFRYKVFTVLQIQLRKRNSPTSMTRDYIYNGS